jgi:hypothetical protein
MLAVECLVEDEVGEESRGEGSAGFILLRNANGRAGRGWYVSEAPALLPHTAAGRSANKWLVQ